MSLEGLTRSTESVKCLWSQAINGLPHPFPNTFVSLLEITWPWIALSLLGVIRHAENSYIQRSSDFTSKNRARAYLSRVMRKWIIDSVRPDKNRSAYVSAR